MSYLLHLLVLVDIYVILTLSLNLLVGYTGLVTLAHGAFFGFGAYAAAIAMVRFHVGLTISAASGILVAAILSFLLAVASWRFRGDHFLLASVALQIVTTAVLQNWLSLTNGPFGISGIVRPRILGLKLDSERSYAVFATVLAGCAVWFFTRLGESPFCRALKSVREDQVAAEALGRSVGWLKVQSVVIASGVAGGAGVLYAHYVRYIDPGTFTLDESIGMLSMVILGGSGNIRGPLIGTALLVLVPELLRRVVGGAAAGNLRMLFYGLALTLAMRIRPRGISGDYRFD